MMDSRCNGPILLGTIAIWVALAVMEPDINVKKPYGPRMCERFCNRISGCSSYIYRTSDLSCDVTPTASPKQNPGKGVYLINVIKDKEKMHAENVVNCTHGEMIFYTRGSLVRCRPILSRYPTLSGRGGETKGRMTRILTYTPRFQQPWKQIYLSNNSVADYSLVYKHVYTIVYISRERKFVMSIMSPPRLIFIPDNEKKTVIDVKRLARGIATDEHKQLMFIKVTSPENGVCSMSTDGKNITLLHSFKPSECDLSSSGGLVADNKRSLIYVLCNGYKVFQITYQGVFNGVVAGSGNVHGYDLYMQGDDLYYQTKVHGSYHIHKLSLSYHTVTAYRTQHKIPKILGILIVGNIIYTTSNDRNARGVVFVGNLSDMGTVTKININFKQLVCMCFIP